MPIPRQFTVITQKTLLQDLLYPVATVPQNIISIEINALIKLCFNEHEEILIQHFIYT
jgi:hypothetical protein